MLPEAATTAAEVIRGRAGDTNIGLVFEGESWTWAEVVSEMSARAAWLRSLTAGRPPHVGVLLDNVPGFLFTLGATMMTGSVLVGLNSTRRGAELAADIRHTDCAVIVTDAEHASLLDGLDLGGASVVDVDDAPAPSGADDPGPSAPSPDDLGLLLFTAGSTGTPKAVRVTQGRMARSATGFGFTSDDVLYCAMPLFHGNALFSSVIPAMGCGASIVLRRRFSASETMPDIRSASATFFATIGRALSFIVGTPADPEDRHHHLRFVLAPESSPSDMAAFEARFGCPVFSGYGSSENAVIFVPRPGLPADALGVPLKGLDVAIIDPDTGEECEAARFDVVVVETVGTGQSEVAVEAMVDCFLVLVGPGSGDELQGIKRGIIELADLVAVTKADGDLQGPAKATAAEYAAALRLLRPKHAEWTPTVLTCSAQLGTGIEELWSTIETYRETLGPSGALTRRRAEQARDWMWGEIGAGLLERVRAAPEIAALATRLETEAVAGRIPPPVAADRVLEAFLGDGPHQE